MIRFQNVTVKFHLGTALEHTALQDVSLKIEEGEFITVIGGNGAGKSTLLGVLCGNIVPARGRVYIDNIDVTSWPVWKRTQYIARVFQDPMIGTCSQLTIEENLALAHKRTQSRSLKKALDRQGREKFVVRLKNLGLGLEKRLRDPMGSLSGGQRQAVSLMMSTLQPMSILVLDEHTAALDPKTAAFVMELTSHIIAEHRLTALMVTHSLNHAAAHGNRVIMLHEGAVQQDINKSHHKNLTAQDLLDMFHVI